MFNNREERATELLEPAVLTRGETNNSESVIADGRMSRRSVSQSKPEGGESVMKYAKRGEESFGDDRASAQGCPDDDDEL